MRRREIIAGIGSAAALPNAARAQQSVPIIGVLGSSKAGDYDAMIAAFRKGWPKRAISKERTSASNTHGQMITMIGCLRLPPS